MEVSGSRLIRYGDSGQEFIAPGEITEIGDLAFAGAGELVSVRLHDHVDKIGNYAFMNCYSLREIRFPPRVSSIGTGLFQNCWKIRRISFPEGTETIGSDMFDSCHSLLCLDLPSTLQTVERTALSGCRNLKEIHIHPSQLGLLPPSARYTAALTFMEDHSRDMRDRRMESDAGRAAGYEEIDDYVSGRQRSFLDLAVNRRSSDAVRYMLGHGLLSEDSVREFLTKASETDRVEITALLLGSGMAGGSDPVLNEDPFL